MKEDFDPETLYELLYNKRWKKFLSILNREKDAILSNHVAIQATNLFFDEFIKSVKINDPVLYLDEFDIIILLHTGKYYKLSDEQIKTVIHYKMEGLIKRSSSEAFNFAKDWKRYDFALKFCKEYESKQPEIISHSFSDEISVTHNKNIGDTDFTIPLFKSTRESNFFKAVKEFFPNYHTYPNVAISCIIDFKKIESYLQSEQKDYFLKSIVDCVVFDSFENYQPKYFFEIDSNYHDSDDRKLKDSWKDLFFSRAGQKLYRIRPLEKRIDKEMFLNVIKDLFV